ncbi:hypothetical protein Tco_0877944 [Tanacetum coccineum]|uniref:Uncharacterized protein n=1 Tax=Tanacetum coccineum TaxID=301880 RepID=A0ABQ5BY46_9ASTR
MDYLFLMLNDAIKRSESYQMFLKYSTGQIPPKKSRGKGSQGKRTTDTPVADFEVSEESDSEPARKRTASRRVVKKKVIISAADNIIPDPDFALGLGKSISSTEATEEEAACKVSATSKGLYYASSQRKQENQQKTARSSDEEVDLIDFDEDEEKKDDDDDDKIIDLEKTDNEETDDDFVHSVNNDEDKEMTNVKVEDSGKGDAEIFDVAKANAKKIKEIKDDAKKAELPPTSSNLSVSLGFGDQFLKISSDTSLLDLIQKYSMKPTPDSSKIQKPTVDPEQESKKTASEIHKVKKELAEKQKMLKYSIKSTNKAALKETPLAGPTQGKKTKRRRTKESESSKKSSTTKETPKGKASSKGYKIGKSASAKEPVEEPIAEVIMDDVVNAAGEDVVRDDDQPQDTSEPKTNKTLNQDWFKQPPRPLTPDPEWNKRQVVLDQPKQPWFNQMVSAKNDPLTFNDLMATPIDFSKYVLNLLKIDNLTQDLLLGLAYNLLKGTCTSNIKLKYNFQECFNALTDKLDWNNPEGYCYPFNLSKPLPLQGRPCHLTVADDYFFNNDLDVKKLNGYGHLEEVVVKRDNRQLYKFKEGDFIDLHLNDIEDML